MTDALTSSVKVATDSAHQLDANVKINIHVTDDKKRRLSSSSNTSGLLMTGQLNHKSSLSSSSSGSNYAFLSSSGSSSQATTPLSHIGPGLSPKPLPKIPVQKPISEVPVKPKESPYADVDKLHETNI